MNLVLASLRCVGIKDTLRRHKYAPLSVNPGQRIDYKMMDGYNGKQIITRAIQAVA